MITAEQLRHIAPKAKPANLELYAGLLSLLMPKYGISTKARMSPFLANLAHESGSFNYTEEIASGAAYEGRRDLGNVVKGDGIRFKGRGLIQVTGRDMYVKCSHALYQDDRLIDNPEQLEEPGPATESACWFWANVKALNDVADKPDDWKRVWKDKTYSKFQWIVLRINGGQNGLKERETFLQRALEIL